MKDDTRKKRITAAVIAVLIIAAVAVFAVSICMKWRLARLCDISTLPAEIDCLNIHESGSITGRRDADTTIYKEGSKYFIDYIDHGNSETPERVELTKTEFLLCTYVDENYLEEALPSTASDNIYYEITIKRQDGGEVTVPRKSYMMPYFGLTYIIREKDRYINDPEFDYDRCIKLASYMYAQNLECAQLAGSPSKGIPYNMYLMKNFREFPLDMQKEIKDISDKLRGSKKPEVIAERAEYLKECEKVDWAGSTAYCKELGDDDFYGFYMKCFEPEPSYMFLLCKRPEGVSCRQLKKDLLTLTSDTPDSPGITFPTIAGGALIIALAAYALVHRGRRKNDTPETEGSTNEADKDQA